MGLFRKKQSSEPHALSRREEQLLSRITELEQYIETAPDRIRREMEDEITTMPAPDDLVDRRREHKFYAQLSRGEIRNERRHQTRGGLLFLLLAAAIAGLSSWIYSFLQGALTLQVIAKALFLAVVAGVIFFYFRAETREDGDAA